MDIFLYSVRVNVSVVEIKLCDAENKNRFAVIIFPRIHLRHIIPSMSISPFQR